MKPGPIDEAFIAIILRELLKALEYLHEEGKIHRDIKGSKRVFSNLRSRKHSLVGEWGCQTS